MPTIECPKCKGTGGIPDGSILGAVIWGFKGRKCDLCEGTGYIRDNTVLEIRSQIGSNYRERDEYAESSKLKYDYEARRRELDASREEMYRKIAELRRISDRNRRDFYLSMDAGKEFYKAGKYAQAAGCYLEAASVEMSPCEVSIAWNWAGHCLQRLGKYADALNAFDMSIRQDCSSTLASAWSYKSDILKLLGRHADAEIAQAKAKRLGYKD